ncbi:WEB family protein At1g12150 [Ricinus communis]|uniref:DNA double-strand break repair rad50 ATPase, putative n=1 Tax=Ricinus communis TaxID=3988 RepID=B9SA58_RICCO|nr:WEB family protein At1g12150 [Ricinus communis]EEF39477.1 DNA double-strand break repair rad50 ATPase, putative [Ricinus communis]|eukprot:XP_002522877.1 WEB family protein At1g12150 [Ricinus communis]
MVKIRSTDHNKNLGSPKVEVGEIDTRAPFQSVKAAVSLFGEVATSKDKDKATTRKSRLSSENVLDKETQLLLAQRELEKYKLQLQTAETVNARANSELEKAKIALNALTTKLNSANGSKLSAIEVAEAVKKQAKQLEVEHLGNAARKQELDQEREQYTKIVTELDLAKQELTKVRQDFDAALDAKSASFQQAAEAQRLANMNAQRVTELAKEIRAMQESNQQLKLISAQAQEQIASIVAGKEGRIQACKIAKEEVDKNLESLRQDYDPEMTRNLEVKLVETTVGIEALQEEMRKAHAFEMSAVKFITTELNEATKTLQEVVEQEALLRNIVTSLKNELEDVKKEKGELQMKEVKELVKERKDPDGLSDEQRSMLEKLSTETEIARREAEEINKNSEKLKQEAVKGRLVVEEGKRKLEIVLAMVEQAKERERRAHDEMKVLSEKQKSENIDSDNHNTIKMSLQDFELLKKKVEECDNIAEAKEIDAITEVEASNERKIAAERKMEENLKSIEEIKEATEIALKSAEMAEAAQNVVEGELRRWRQKVPVTSP